MPDVPALPTAAAPGKETTEYKIAKWMAFAGVSVQGIAAGLAALLPNANWIAGVISASGLLMAISAALGYQVPRAAVKSEALKLEQAKVLAASNALKAKRAPVA